MVRYTVLMLSSGVCVQGRRSNRAGGVSTGCAKVTLFEDFRGVSKALRSPKSSKGAATGLSRAEGDWKTTRTRLREQEQDFETLRLGAETETEGKLGQQNWG